MTRGHPDDPMPEYYPHQGSRLIAGMLLDWVAEDARDPDALDELHGPGLSAPDRVSPGAGSDKRPTAADHLADALASIQAAERAGVPAGVVYELGRARERIESVRERCA